MVRARLVALAVFVPLAAQAAEPRVTEPQVRAFVQRQSRAWNAGDLAGYFALFTPQARFTEQARARDGRVVPYGTSTVAQARDQARRFFAGAKAKETTTIRGVAIAPDGRSVRVTADEVSLTVRAGRTRRTCAERLQTIVATPQGLRSTGQIDTLVRCW